MVALTATNYTEITRQPGIGIDGWTISGGVLLPVGAGVGHSGTQLGHSMGGSGGGVGCTGGTTGGAAGGIGSIVGTGVIGGIRIQVGHEVIDGSIAARLADLTLQLAR